MARPGPSRPRLRMGSVASGIAGQLIPGRQHLRTRSRMTAFAMAAGPSWRAPWRRVDRADRWPPDDRIAPHAIARRTGPASVSRRASRTTGSPAPLCADSETSTAAAAASASARSLLSSTALSLARSQWRQSTRPNRAPNLARCTIGFAQVPACVRRTQRASWARLTSTQCTTRSTCNGLVRGAHNDLFSCAVKLGRDAPLSMQALSSPQLQGGCRRRVTAIAEPGDRRQRTASPLSPAAQTRPALSLRVERRSNDSRLQRAR